MAKQFPSHLKPTIPVSPFTVDIPEKDVADFKHLLRLSKLPSATYEGQHRKFGVTSAWMRKAKDQWENEYDW